jgi:hypothetical protein
MTLGSSGRQCADENGNVVVDVPEAGVYNLFVWATDGLHGHQWVGRDGGTGAQLNGRLVVVAAGQTVTVPPIRLDRAGTITGVLTGAGTGSPPPGIVGLTTFNAGFGPTGAHFETDSDGRYTIGDLGPYRWVLYFAGEGHASQFSGGTPHRFLAEGVRVRAGQTTVYDQALRRGATVSVTVRRPQGQPFEFARVTARHALTGDELGAGDCSPQTRCEIRLLGPGLVKLHYDVFGDDGSFSGYHRDAEDFAHARIVVTPVSGTKQLTVMAS